jgi:hypothetical protein
MAAESALLLADILATESEYDMLATDEEVQAALTSFGVIFFILGQGLRRGSCEPSSWPGAAPYASPRRRPARCGAFCRAVSNLGYCAEPRLHGPWLRRYGRPGTAAPRPGATSPRHLHRLGVVLLRAVIRIRALHPDRRRRASFRWPGAGPTRAAVRPGGAPRLRPPRRHDCHLRTVSAAVDTSWHRRGRRFRDGSTVTSAVAQRRLVRPARRCCFTPGGDLVPPTGSAPCSCGLFSASGCAPCSSKARRLPLARRRAYAGRRPGRAVRPEYDHLAVATVTSPAVRRPSELLLRAPGAISHFHRLGAVPLRAVLRIRAVRPDRRRRTTFRWPGAGPTRAAAWAGRCTLARAAVRAGHRGQCVSNTTSSWQSTQPSDAFRPAGVGR